MTTLRVLMPAITFAYVPGKPITDPKVQFIANIAGWTAILGMVGLALTTRMVDEARVRSEPKVSSLFGRGLPPRRVLTDSGRKLRLIAQVMIGVGIALALFAGWIN